MEQRKGKEKMGGKKKKKKESDGAWPKTHLIYCLVPSFWLGQEPKTATWASSFIFFFFSRSGFLFSQVFMLSSVFLFSLSIICSLNVGL